MPLAAGTRLGAYEILSSTTEGSFHVQDPDGFEVQMGGKTQ